MQYDVLCGDLNWKLFYIANMARVSFPMTPQVFYYLLIIYIKGDVRDKNASNIETVYVNMCNFLFGVHMLSVLCSSYG